MTDTVPCQLSYVEHPELLLPPDYRPPGQCISEMLWATPYDPGAGLYQLANTPFLTLQLSAYDLVRLSPDGRFLERVDPIIAHRYLLGLVGEQHDPNAALEVVEMHNTWWGEDHVRCEAMWTPPGVWLLTAQVNACQYSQSEVGDFVNAVGLSRSDIFSHGVGDVFYKQDAA